MRRVLLVVAHPRRDSFTWSVADLLVARARDSGSEVLVHDLYADGFDPLLTAEESRHVQLGVAGPAGDALTARYREDLTSADVLVALHPNWWGKPPAAMSGWLDRVLAPGVAYKLQGGAAGEPEALLRLDALVVTFGDTPADRETAEFGDPLHLIWTRCVLPYVGAGHVERRHVTPVGSLTAGERAEAAETCWAALADLLGVRPEQ
ncbi:NAD(P)H-dependent oxidoreductase [Nocardioides anomalus]|uniref:NAD(P)H-dependent oxidoreductase n=1 Tax=Nocardioides anomalus TaxID=2712223 RepID=A0A6G6W9M0_9ACTN|nr:NAD(P)H-dependent oxidoreductase [Nocardioides anomalus]QIG41916.1 NAD(P)H-dependent oxidoreductase [Nocardioides anomalus]